MMHKVANNLIKLLTRGPTAMHCQKSETNETKWMYGINPPPLTIFNQQVRESPQPKTDPTLILQAQQEHT